MEIPQQCRRILWPVPPLLRTDYGRPAPLGHSHAMAITISKVSVPLIPGPLAELGRRPFSLYPAIVGIQHNQWFLRRATLLEIEVVNTKSKVEVMIPRRFVGEVSRVEAPVMIVGLIKELEYKAGAVVPHRRHVIEMPRAVNGSVPRRRPVWNEQPGAVVEIRLDRGPESRPGRRLLGSIAAGLLACVGVGIGVRDGHVGTRSGFPPAAHRDMPLDAQDDYRSVVNKLGSPAYDRWQTVNGVTYHRLFYPRRSLVVILAGDTHENARYAGTTAFDGREIQSATPGRLDDPLLRHVGR